MEDIKKNTLDQTYRDENGSDLDEEYTGLDKQILQKKINLKMEQWQLRKMKEIH